MTSDDVPELPPATLLRCPAILSLPTADPHALVIECMLRFVGAHYVRRDAPWPVSLEIPVSNNNNNNNNNNMQRHAGLSACLHFIESNTHLDAEVLPSEQRPLSLCVRILAEKVLLPAFVYITHSDNGIYNNAIRKGVVPKIGTLWQRLRGNYKASVLNNNNNNNNNYCGQFRNINEALAEVERGLRMLEAINVANAKAAGAFLLGTERPCSADALAYAAASSFLHADFASHHASAEIIKLQHCLKEDCPALVKYVEKLRLLYFEEYSAFYTLRATSGEEEKNDASWNSFDETCRRGRWRTLALTFGFTAMFFIFANAEFILSLLSEFEEVGEEAMIEEAEQQNNQKS